MQQPSSADLLAMNEGRWRREPIVVEAIPAEMRPLFAVWYADLALTNDQIGKPDEALYCRGMVTKLTGGQP